jgi:hypothetical protein
MGQELEEEWVPVHVGTDWRMDIVYPGTLWSQVQEAEGTKPYYKGQGVNGSDEQIAF